MFWLLVFGLQPHHPGTAPSPCTAFPQDLADHKPLQPETIATSDSRIKHRYTLQPKTGWGKKKIHLQTGFGFISQIYRRLKQKQKPQGTASSRGQKTNTGCRTCSELNGSVYSQFSTTHQAGVNPLCLPKKEDIVSPRLSFLSLKRVQKNWPW